ncbi:MAG: hypothetical protein WCO56_17340 [Verrucomicrobiota bacterium]
MPPPAKTGLARARSKLGQCSRSQAWDVIEANNHHIRRLLSALGVEALRLLRITVGALPLRNLAKGQWRTLTPAEVRQLGGMHD